MDLATGNVTINYALTVSGGITGALTGNASTATALQTSRNFSISGGGITAAAVGFTGAGAVALNASVDAGHITLARMADLATGRFIGRVTGSTGVPEALTGTQATTLLDVATGSLKGLMSAADFTKLAGIAAGATANSADASLLARANHTGSQAASTISDFSEAVDDRVGALTTAGNGMVVTYDDAGNALTLRPKVRLTGGFVAKPAASQKTPIGIAPAAFTVTQANCAAFAITAATASYVITIKKRSTGGTDTTVGTLTWAAAGTVATVSISAGSISAGDMLFLECPAADATIENIAVLVSE
jgi:hypothetical protein